MKGLGKAALTGLILLLYMPVSVSAAEPSRDTADEIADGRLTQTDSSNASKNYMAGNANTNANTNQGVEHEKMRHELDYLKNVNIQMMRRIQALERELATSVSHSTTSATRQSAGAPTNALDSTAGKTNAEQTHAGVVKKPQKAHAVEDLVLEEHTLFNQTFSLELGFEYSHFDQNQLILNGFLALDAIFLGDLSVDEIEGDIFKTNLVARWGVTDRLQLSLNAPWVYRETTSRSRGVDLSSIIVSEKTVDDSDIGDVSLSASYQLFPETISRPDIVLNLSVKAPTGREPYGIDFLEDPSNTNLVYPEELPTGTGLWALSGGVSFLKTTDPSILFASVFYTHYLEKSFGDIGADPGAPPSPGDVQLGDEFQIAAGIAFALNDRTSLSMSFSQKFIDETEITQPGLGTREIIGSDTTAGKFDIGLTYALTERLSLVTSLGMGLTNDSSDYTFNLKFPYRF